MDEAELDELRKSLGFAVEIEQCFAAMDETRYGALKGLVDEGVRGLGGIVKAIDRVLDRYGKIADNASPELARIRREIANQQGSVSRTLAAILRQAKTLAQLIQLCFVHEQTLNPYPCDGLSEVVDLSAGQAHFRVLMRHTHLVRDSQHRLHPRVLRLHLHRLYTLASQTRRTPTTQLFTNHREVNLLFYVCGIKHL